MSPRALRDVKSSAASLLLAARCVAQLTGFVCQVLHVVASLPWFWLCVVMASL